MNFCVLHTTLSHSIALPLNFSFYQGSSWFLAFLPGLSLSWIGVFAGVWEGDYFPEVDGHISVTIVTLVLKRKILPPWSPLSIARGLMIFFPFPEEVLTDPVLCRSCANHFCVGLVQIITASVSSCMQQLWQVQKMSRMVPGPWSDRCLL